MTKQTGFMIRAGVVILEGPYKGVVILKVHRNGWCQGFYPSNITSFCSLEEATFKVRAHQLFKVGTKYKLITE